MENPMDAAFLQGFYLGDLLIEPLKGRVSGGNGEHHLPPKAAEVLVCLARHAGDIVPHEELLKCAWAEGSGTREALSHTIGEILMGLPDDLTIYPGHGPATTIGRERATNMFVVHGF